MELLLARHGNTFAAGDKVVWVGGRSDPPLVESGRRQAAEIGRALIAGGRLPCRIYAGPLRRTRETADLAARAMGLVPAPLVVAPDLREIDYGSWEGRSNDEIRAEHGGEAIDGWQAQSLWPDGFGWSPSEAEVIAAWSHLLRRIAAENAPDCSVLVVSSNGIWRLVAKSLGLAPATAKMATGALSRLDFDRGAVRVLDWNLAPAEFAARQERT